MAIINFIIEDEVNFSKLLSKPVKVAELLTKHLVKTKNILIVNAEKKGYSYLSVKNGRKKINVPFGVKNVDLDPLLTAIVDEAGKRGVLDVIIIGENRKRFKRLLELTRLYDDNMYYVQKYTSIMNIYKQKLIDMGFEDITTDFRLANLKNETLLPVSIGDRIYMYNTNEEQSFIFNTSTFFVIAGFINVFDVNNEKEYYLDSNRQILLSVNDIQSVVIERLTDEHPAFINASKYISFPLQKIVAIENKNSIQDEENELTNGLIESASTIIGELSGAIQPVNKELSISAESLIEDVTPKLGKVMLAEVDETVKLPNLEALTESTDNNTVVSNKNTEEYVLIATKVTKDFLEKNLNVTQELISANYKMQNELKKILEEKPSTTFSYVMTDKNGPLMEDIHNRNMVRLIAQIQKVVDVSVHSTENPPLSSIEKYGLSEDGNLVKL